MSGNNRVTVGCPIRGREWILRRWTHHINVSLAKTDLEADFLFLVDEGDRIQDILLDLFPEAEILEYKPNERYIDNHKWSREGLQPYLYNHMADIRNVLLERVREKAPDYYLSLDSDMLVTENLVSNLIESSERFDAVGGKAYMTPDQRVPSYGLWTRNGTKRVDTNYVIPVNIIMAIKLMKPSAYHVDYAYHHSGEDFGWSLAAKRAKLKLGFDGRECAKHVMTRDMLYTVDRRLGW